MRTKHEQQLQDELYRKQEKYKMENETVVRKNLEDLLRENNKLKSQLEQAQKACAEMRDALNRVFEDGLVTNMPEWRYRASAALDHFPDAGNVMGENEKLDILQAQAQ